MIMVPMRLLQPSSLLIRDIDVPYEINCYRGEAGDPYDRCFQEATRGADAGFAIDHETTGEVQ